MINSFKTILIGGDNAKRAAFKIAEFDYLSGLPFSVKAIVNPSASEKFVLVNHGWKWVDLPVFKTLAEMLEFDENVDSAVICLNAKYVLEWVKIVLKQKIIKNITILAEDVPEKDALELVFLSQKHDVNIVGPSSTGILAAGVGRLGEIGGDWKNLNLCHLNIPGNVGLITKSGGMAGEFMWVISQNSPGISTAVQIGGDAFPATDFAYWLEKFSKDENTKIVVMAGEAGGDLEERAGRWYKNYRSQFTVDSRQVDDVHSNNDDFTVNREPNSTVNRVSTVNREPVSTVNHQFKLIACISGKFLEHMPKGQKFGHAGAKQEESGFGSAKNKIEVLQNAGVEVVSFENLGKRLKELGG